MQLNWKNLLCEDRLSGTTRQSQERRSEIHRDYGRLVFSTPVRRLQDKAQVFPLEPIDAVRTRLTHSLEVSSVARGLGHIVATRLVENGTINHQEAYDIETIAATCGLLHDIGNPPFGHAGERAIQDWFKKQPEEFWEFDQTPGKSLKKDLVNFEGNAHTLRLLAKLQVLSDRNGLNLTCATLSAALKYTANSDEIGTIGRQSKKKLGYFTAERDLVQKVREKTCTGDARNPITFLVEASDDIVYSVVDIEDGIKKGVISWSEVKTILEEHRAKIGDDVFKDCVTATEERIARASVDLRGSSRDEAMSQYFRTRVILQGQDAVFKAFFGKRQLRFSSDDD